jgi:hypothetical protein
VRSAAGVGALAIALTACMTKCGRHFAVDNPEAMRIYITDSGAEGMLTDRLESMHMDDSDIDCFVGEIKKTKYWRDFPKAVYLSEETFPLVAARCDIDVSELWYDPPHYHD